MATLAKWYGLNSRIPQDSCDEVLLPIVRVFGSRAFGRLLALHEILKMGPQDGMIILMKEASESLHSLVLFLCFMRTQQEGSNQQSGEKFLYQNPGCCLPDLGFPSSDL